MDVGVRVAKFELGLWVLSEMRIFGFFGRFLVRSR